MAQSEQYTSWRRTHRPPDAAAQSAVLHPGHVRCVRELAGQADLIATHNDTPDVLVWNMRTQPDRRADLVNAMSDDFVVDAADVLVWNVRM